MSAQVDEDFSAKLRECTPLEFSIHLEEIIESVIGVYKAGNQNDAAALAIDVCAAVDACASDSDAALGFQPWYTEYLKVRCASPPSICCSCACISDFTIEPTDLLESLGRQWGSRLALPHLCISISSRLSLASTVVTSMGRFRFCCLSSL